MAGRRRPATEYDPRQPVSREEWLTRWAELRQRVYPGRRQAVKTVERSIRGKSQIFREEAG